MIGGSSPSPPTKFIYMTLEQYKKELMQHDWYYQFSDDHRIWQRGESTLAELRYIAKQNGAEFAQAYKEASDAHP